MKLRRRLSWFWLGGWACISFIVHFLVDPPAFNLEQVLQSPGSNAAPLGTDTYGRNLLHLAADSSLLSLTFAGACVVVAMFIALLVAGSAHAAPRRIQEIIESLLQFLLAFPSLLFGLTVGGIFGPGRATLAVALLLGAVPGLTRSLWTRARELSSQEFLWAARALGATPVRLALHHYLPHLYSLARVKIPTLLLHALLAEASLSFLGLGFPIGQESWGSLLAQGRDYLIEAPHVSLAAGIPLVLTLLALDVVSKPTSGTLT